MRIDFPLKFLYLYDILEKLNATAREGIFTSQNWLKKIPKRNCENY